MHLKPLVAACALALTASSAMALNINTTTPDVTVRISGSSALQNTLVGISESMMVAGSIDVYEDTGSSGSNFRAVYGTMKATGTPVGATTIPSSLGGKKVLLIERAQGGSFQGVGPVARAQSITFMKVANDGSCTAVSGGTYPGFTFQCSGTESKIPDGGVSDVEPALFQTVNLPAGETALSASELASINAASQNAVIFGIAVTNNVPLTSLSSQQVTAILAGNYQDWSQVSSSLSGPITLETRAAGSGTKAWSNAMFLVNPCSPTGQQGPAVTTGDPVNFSVYTVVENSSTGGVKSGLNSVFAKGQKGVGIISYENAPGASDNWKFVAIDGLVPSDATNPVHNAVLGNYSNFVEQSMQWRNSAPAGAVLDYMSTFRTVSGDPAILKTLKGVAALPLNYDRSTNPDANYIMIPTRSLSGANTCTPGIMTN